MADQLVGHQVFKHLLAVLLAVAQMIVMQHEIVAALGTHAQRLLPGVGGVHFLDPQFPQHGPD